MLNHLLGMDGLPLDFKELVFEKTEGVPFYIEELIKSLRINVTDKNDLSSMARGDHIVKIPATIQDVIMSRVDRLPERSKEILQSGAVIEREFSYKLLKQVMDFPEQELVTNINILKDSELIYERGIFPESKYIFKHALTREVIYDSILSNKKKELHEKIGNNIEDLYKENIADYYGVLSEHFLQSENYEKSIGYSKMAGKAAQKRSAFNDAISYAKKSIYCLEELPKTDAIQRKLIDARTTLSVYYIILNHYVESMEAVTPIADLAKEKDYQKRLPRIFVATGIYSCAVEEDFPKGIEELKKAIEFSEKTGDFLSLWNAYWYLGFFLSFECKFENSSNYFKKAIDLSVAANSLFGIVMAKSTLANFNLNYQGKVNIAHEISKEALLPAKESNDIYLKATAISLHGFCCYFKGLFDKAERDLLEGLVLSEKVSLLMPESLVAFLLGNIYCEKGDFKKAKGYYNNAVLSLKKGKINPSWVRLFKTCIANNKLMHKGTDVNLITLYNDAHENKLKVFDGWISRIIGEILMNLDDQDKYKAEEWILRAIELDGKRGLRWNLAMDHAVCSDLYKKKGDSTKAKENLFKAIDIFKECGADGWVEKYEEELASLS